MKKWSVIFLTVLTAVLLVACGNQTSSKEETKKEPAKESKQANAVKKEVAKMQKELKEVTAAAEKEDKGNFQATANTMHKHWLAFENNVRDLYPLQYTDVEKYETPIFYASKNTKPDYNEVKTNTTGLDKALDVLSKAKENKAKSSEVLKQAVKKYQAYVVDQTDQFVTATETFAKAVKSGDIEKAKAAYSAPRVYYERIEPIAESFGDLDPKLDARINDVDNEKDWTGYHVIERALWEKKSLAGMDKYADQLVKDAKSLQKEVAKLKLEPKPMVAGAMELLNEAATTKITGEEEAYSHTDLVDLNANVEGSKVVYQAIVPALTAQDKKLADDIDAAFNKMEDTLAAYREGDSFVNYKKLSKKQIREISNELSHLSELMAKTGKIF